MVGDEVVGVTVKDMLGVDGVSHVANLEVEVGAVGAASVAAEADDIASLDLLAGLYVALGHVGVVGFQSIGVVNDDEVAVGAVVFGDTDGAVEGGVDGFACGLSEVEAVVEAAAAWAEVGGGPGGDGGRPMEVLSEGIVAKLYGDRRGEVVHIEAGEVNGCGVESFKEDVVLAVDTVVAEAIVAGETLFIARLFLLFFLKQEGSGVEVVFCFLVVAVVDDNPFELLVLVDDVEFVDFYFRFIGFLVGVVGLGDGVGRVCQ